MDRAEIFCLCFNQLSTFLACSSDKGTIHIFSLNSNQNNGNDIDSLSSSISNQSINNNNNKNQIITCASDSNVGDDFDEVPNNFFYNDNSASNFKSTNVSQNNIHPILK
jgi:hypothetical protein